LLEEAHRSLATAPRHTLEVAEAHRRRFPRGQYAQEREVLAIEALLALHEQARASARARHFLLRYPESSHARHVRALLAETEEAPASGAGTQLP
jgi:outer membrane protein assembly factor BamD (BamD/ComL family)